LEDWQYQNESISYSGPHDSADVWLTYRENANKWFRELGLSVITDAINFNAIGQIGQPEFTFYYCIAHGDWRVFIADPNNVCTVDNIREYLKDRGRFGFAFLGQCRAMVKIGSGSFSYTFRKGKSEKTVTIGYYKADECPDGWRYSFQWQDRMFSYLKQGLNFKEAYDEAIADYPSVGPMVRFVGDESLTLSESTTIMEKEEEERKGCLIAPASILRGG